MDQDYKLSKKGPDGKWRSYGNVKKNKWGNLEAGIKCTPDFKALVAGIEEGAWLNLALFPAEERPKQAEYDDTPF